MGTGRHDNTLGRDDGIARLDPIGADEFSFLLDHPHTETFEALDGIVRRDGADHAVHVVMHFPEIDIGFRGIDTEPVRRPDGVRRMRGRDHRLGRHAAVVQAVAAHLRAFDEDDLGPHLGRAGGDGQTAGPAADNAYISGNLVRHV